MLKTLLLLCYEFFKTGLFAVGGGLATIPFLREISEVYGWYDLDTLSMMIGISESTPGAMGVNMATYVGYNVGGFVGGIITTLALVAPSIIVICIIAKYLPKFKKLTVVKEIFAGIKPSVIGFIIAAVYDLYLTTLFNTEAGLGLGLFNIPCIITFIILLIIYYKFDKLHPIFIIVLAAIAGIIFSL